MFPDNTALGTGSIEKLNRFVFEFEKVWHEIKLKLYVGKSKAMKYNTSEGQGPCKLRLNGAQFEGGDKLNCFGEWQDGSR